MGKAVLISYERNGCEMYYEEKTAEKPEKWPANAREQILDTLCECVEEFKKNPSYKTREVLLSLTCEHDLNLNENFGLVRVIEYEVGILNFLYLVGNAYQISSLKTYILNKISSPEPISSKSINIKFFSFNIDALYIFAQTVPKASKYSGLANSSSIGPTSLLNNSFLTSS